MSRLDQPPVQRHVESCHRFYQLEATAEIGNRTNRRRCRLPATRHGLASLDGGAPHRDSDQPRSRGVHREGDLNRLAWRQIEAVKPGCGGTGEDCLPRKAPNCGGKQKIGVLSHGLERVIAATEPAPTRTEQVILRQPMAPSLLKVEGTRLQGVWNQWSSRHAPESWTVHPRRGILRIKGWECCEKREWNPSNADWPHTQRLRRRAQQDGAVSSRLGARRARPRARGARLP